MKCPRHTPLCPAGHLPLKGGEWLAGRLHTPQSGGDWQKTIHRLISPLEGEMSGRTEGGATAPTVETSPTPSAKLHTNVKRPLLPASGEKVRMRGERRQDGEKELVIPGLTGTHWQNAQEHGPVFIQPPPNAS